MPYGIIFLLVVRLIVYLVKSDKKVPKPDGNIMYLVNDMIIDKSHISHAREKLGLMKAEIISDEIINHAYNNVFNEISELRKSETVIVDVSELRATKLYMLDRWVYLGHKN